LLFKVPLYAQQEKKQREVLLPVQIERSYSFDWKAGSAVNVLKRDRIERLDNDWESVELKDVGHETKESQTQIQVEASKRFPAVIDVREMEFGSPTYEFQFVDRAGYLLQNFSDVARRHNNCYERFSLGV
jgi:hypothetical protein